MNTEQYDICKLELSAKIIDTLHAAGIYKIAVLEDMSYDDLIKLPNMNHKSLWEIDVMFYSRAICRGEIEP